MLTALTRAVSRSLAECELTWQAREPIDIDLASAQHAAYENALRELGVRVISLPEERELPDAVFVEDPLFVVDAVAIVTRLGAVSRRPESASLERAISAYRPVRRIHAPGTLEGGDIMRIDRDIFVGLSTRTNRQGIEQLARELESFAYRVIPLPVTGCLHLKSACCSIGDGRILANRAWLDPAALRGYEVIDVAAGEPGAANILRIGNTVIMPEVFPRTAEVIERFGLQIRTVDISELMKAEAAVTCSSVIFEVA